MRSIFIHFPSADELRVRAWLDQHARSESGDSWTYPPTGDELLWISVEAPAQLGDWEPVESAIISDVVGTSAGLVQVDISGRIPGDDEVSEVTLSLLEVSPGARAQDDYTSHLWTVDELRSIAKVEGHPFFDYRGWYAATEFAD